MKLFTTFLIFLFVVYAFPQTPANQSDDMMNMVQDICWSPDGKAIYFSAMRVKKDYSDFKPEKWGVYRYDLKSKAIKKLVDSAFNVTVSPDSKHIAVGKLINGNRDLYVLDADGKNAKRITTDKADDSAPAWSPDGKRIVFNSKREGNVEVFAINSDGTNPKRLTFSGEHKSYNPSWSPDGKYIAYYFEKGDGQDQLFVMKSDGTDAKNITTDEFNNIYPGWFGKNKIIYGQGKKGLPTKVFTVNMDGTDKKQLLTFESFYARFSPDGKKIAYVDGKEKIIKIVSVKGEEIEKIVPQL